MDTTATQKMHESYIALLKSELVPAMGCTEPIAIAYAAAIAKKHLGRTPNRINVCASNNIIKNVKSVVVPNTDGMRGIFAAAAAGIVAGNPDKLLEVIAEITDSQKIDIASFMTNTEFSLGRTDSGHILDIVVSLHHKNHSASVRITDTHTNITRIEKDGAIVFDGSTTAASEPNAAPTPLAIVSIIDFANTVDVARLKETLDAQIQYNMAIANAGLSGKYSAGIGRVLLKCYERSTLGKAKAMAAAGSDARMNGCELPVVINSGSGNQGITASVPVIVYAEDIGIGTEQLYRALIVSNLATIRIKQGIGRLSAYCGVIGAGCGAAAGIAYLLGADLEQISRTIVNGLAINSGIICDGAKPSCAAKIAMAVDGGLLGMNMALCGSRFACGEGIVAADVEETINNVSILATFGMRETDREIIKIMLGN